MSASNADYDSACVLNTYFYVHNDSLAVVPRLHFMARYTIPGHSIPSLPSNPLMPPPEVSGRREVKYAGGRPCFFYILRGLYGITTSLYPV